MANQNTSCEQEPFDRPVLSSAFRMLFAIESIGSKLQELKSSSSASEWSTLDDIYSKPNGYTVTPNSPTNFPSSDDATSKSEKMILPGHDTEFYCSFNRIEFFPCKTSQLQAGSLVPMNEGPEHPSDIIEVAIRPDVGEQLHLLNHRSEVAGCPGENLPSSAENSFISKNVDDLAEFSANSKFSPQVCCELDLEEHLFQNSEVQTGIFSVWLPVCRPYCNNDVPSQVLSICSEFQCEGVQVENATHLGTLHSSPNFKEQTQSFSDFDYPNSDILLSSMLQKSPCERLGSITDSLLFEESCLSTTWPPIASNHCQANMYMTRDLNLDLVMSSCQDMEDIDEIIADYVTDREPFLVHEESQLALLSAFEVEGFFKQLEFDFLQANSRDIIT